jgi:DNA invertase Pin-like site-specific DNA recombinase
MVFGYIRVSTDKQDVESQKIGIVGKAKELGLKIDEWISDEGVSGTMEYNKRNLGVLMERAKDGDSIIVSEISRLARSVFMLFRIIEFCTQINNIAIYSVKDNITALKKGDIMSTMAICFFGISAQIERDMIVKRTIEGLERRRQAGVIFGRPIGAKNKNGSKVKNKIRDIKKYISQGLSVYRISKIIRCNKVTLKRFVLDQNIPYTSHSKNNRIITNCEKMLLFSKEKKSIKTWIDVGLNIKTIANKLREKGYNFSNGSFRKAFTKNRDLYNYAANKCNELRTIYNKDCGKNKLHYAH